MVARVARGAAYFLQRYGKETRPTAETPEKMTASAVLTAMGRAMVALMWALSVKKVWKNLR